LFKINNGGCITVDYDRIVGTHKHGILYMDQGKIEEVILPQSMILKIKARFEEHIGYDVQDLGS